MHEHINTLCKLICILGLGVNADANQQHAKNSIFVPLLQQNQSNKQKIEKYCSNSQKLSDRSQQIILCENIVYNLLG